MQKALKTDQSRVISIITESFRDNPSVVSVINPSKPKSLEALARYAFNTGISRSGVFLSSDQEATAICYQYNIKRTDLIDLWNQLLLTVNAIGLRSVSQVLHREAYIKKIRPKTGEFLYFWFFGTTAQGTKNGAAMELKNHLFELSNTKGLPIYLETSVLKNKRVYEYFGFEVYHEWVQSESTTLWFMKRTPK